MAWTLRTLTDDAGVAARVAGDAGLTGIAYDSRAVRAGDLFCCFPGGSSDGHDHAPDAVARGASCLLVERPLEVDVSQAAVHSVRDALGPLASSFHGRPSESMRVAGVTGTNGKTTTTYLVESIASAAGLTTGLLGTVEYRVAGRTVPSTRTTPEAPDLQRTLAEMRDAGAEVVAMEVASHGLHQRRVSGTRFACAAFTNLTQDHLDYHGTMDDYFEAKALLFQPSYTPRAVINIDDAAGRRLVERTRDLDVLTYGEGGDVHAVDVTPSASGTTAVISTPEGRLETHSPLVGRYNVDNILCATGICLVLGLPLDAVAAGVSTASAPGRLERVDAGQPFTVVVDYAHTPDALASVLTTARQLTQRRLIVVFGCGGDRDRAKRPLMGAAATSIADLAVITSDNPRSEDPGAIIREIAAGVAREGFVTEPDRRRAIERALSEAGPGDVVVIAGKGHETGQTFAGHTIEFDDRTVARELLGGVGCRG
ncbi:MAG TPA: UDP-N-acetylmuramoyl-L-alanyl-D-glutamate--2,6-diaminopimelate ligase [Actinomycetota bacterium]|nr:UDP-N-acetylmuramoyl-L-alanyl-D-glutamate--2,6-diaminopimelate ligase [Actinomycetota bacterium]